MTHDGPPGEPSGYVCPSCGGALWQRQDGQGATAYEYRIGHAFSPGQLWIEHCAARNRALRAAARSLAENAALARDLAELARALGRVALAARLEAEAAAEARHVEQVRAMLGELEAEGTERARG
jgi:two-component system, chemotaxis family, protein-glutamate methylesterase/glutaminase